MPRARVERMFAYVKDNFWPIAPSTLWRNARGRARLDTTDNVRIQCHYGGKLVDLLEQEL
jgi:hypothetical protein